MLKRVQHDEGGRPAVGTWRGGVAPINVSLNLFQGPVFRLQRGAALDAETSSS
jgi:hypothetical protein